MFHLRVETNCLIHLLQKRSRCGSRNVGFRDVDAVSVKELEFHKRVSILYSCIIFYAHRAAHYKLSTVSDKVKTFACTHNLVNCCRSEIMVCFYIKLLSRDKYLATAKIYKDLPKKIISSYVP